MRFRYHFIANLHATIVQIKWLKCCTTSYNSLVMHNSYIYMIAHIWNQLPTVTRSSSTLAQFRARLNNVDFTGCHCMNCIQFYLFLQIFNSKTSFPQEGFMLYSKFILAHIVIYICYLPGGRSVWEKTVPEVLSRPRAVLKTKGTVFSHTDRRSPVNNIFIFFWTSSF